MLLVFRMADEGVVGIAVVDAGAEGKPARAPVAGPCATTSCVQNRASPAS